MNDEIEITKNSRQTWNKVFLTNIFKKKKAFYGNKKKNKDFSLSHTTFQ